MPGGRERGLPHGLDAAVQVCRLRPRPAPRVPRRLEHDPGEMVNLAVDPNYAAILSAHRALLRPWYPAHGETLNARYIENR